MKDKFNKKSTVRGRRSTENKNTRSEKGRGERLRPFAKDDEKSYIDRSRQSTEHKKGRVEKGRTESLRPIEKDSDNRFSDHGRRSTEHKNARGEKGRGERLRPFAKEDEKSYKDRSRHSTEKPKVKGQKSRDKREHPVSQGSSMIRLNKYVANSGVCSRREADKLIESGVIKVNGKVITELGTKINPEDVVEYANQKIKNEKLVYVLLNKPKDFITTMDDPQGRKTVMELVRKACRERIYPVGRLDRNTTGLLLFTNDGELAKKLIHPKYGVKKIYNVLLDKKLQQKDMDKIKNGELIIENEKGENERIEVDAISYIEEGKSISKKEVGVELHSGQNRVVRKIFESLGYDVLKLDRIYFAGLTKKDLPRGKWRLLSKTEIAFLKMGQFK